MAFMEHEEPIKAVVRETAERARRETKDAPDPKFVGDVEWPVTCSVHQGLDGAISTSTKIGYVNGDKGWLVYRGYEIFDLAENSSFEETCYLLLYGDLPSASELKTFAGKLRANREVPPAILETLERIPITHTHPMSALRTAISVLGNLDPKAENTSVASETEVSIKLIAQMASIAAAIARLRHGKEPVAPDPELGHAANFLYMMNGSKPDPELATLMDLSLILHADHGMNASTFSTMVVNSSLSDMYGSITAGLASLKGPLHGGANEAVLYDLEEIGDPANVESWFAEARKNKRKVMGFGHRVYKAYDPRARILGPLAHRLAETHPEIRSLFEVAVKLEETVTSQLGKEKKIFPNVDFYSGLVYRAMGIETSMFTPIFAVSRISGWVARALEYLADNRIFRPRAIYTGPISREYVPFDQR